MTSKIILAVFSLIIASSAYAQRHELEERYMTVGSNWGTRGDLSYEVCLNKSMMAQDSITRRGCWITGNSGCYIESSRDSAVEILRYTATIYYQCR